MTALWTAQEAAQATKGRATGAWAVEGISIDSRSIAKGDLFIALAGPNFDGHAYVAEALKKGAAACVVSRVPEGLSPDAPLLVVGDTQHALEDLGRAARARSAARVIGVTGSAGKTGTKEALSHALGRQGSTVASAGSLNNHWGVPLSLARMPAATRYGVFEIGMNHSGEIDVLTRIARPDVAVITTIAPAHLGHFASIEEIADAKAEIFNGMTAEGTAILNRDNPHYPRLADKARTAGLTRIWSFGEHKDAELHLIDSQLHATASAVTASILGEVVDYCVAIPGPHWVMNSLAVLGAVKAAGGDVAAAAASLGELRALDGRGRRHKIARAAGDIELIDESYNANPASMRMALTVLASAVPAKGGRRIAVLGDMLELGATSGALHAAIAEPIAQNKIDLVFTVGREMRNLHDALPAEKRGGHAETSAEMVNILSRALHAGDVLTVKGSFGSRMGTIVKHLLASGTAPSTCMAEA